MGGRCGGRFVVLGSGFKISGSSAPDPANLIKDQSSATRGLMARLLLTAAARCVGGAVRAVWSRHEPCQERVTPEGIGQVDEKRVDLTYPLGRDKSCGTTRDGTTPPEPCV